MTTDWTMPKLLRLQSLREGFMRPHLAFDRRERLPGAPQVKLLPWRSFKPKSWKS